jgi:hypothetical protein
VRITRGTVNGRGPSPETKFHCSPQGGHSPKTRTEKLPGTFFVMGDVKAPALGIGREVIPPVIAGDGDLFDQMGPPARVVPIEATKANHRMVSLTFAILILTPR